MPNLPLPCLVPPKHEYEVSGFTQLWRRYDEGALLDFALEPTKTRLLAIHNDLDVLPRIRP